MIKRKYRRTCLLCRKRVEETLLCSTRTRHQNTAVMLSSLVLFNEIDMREAKRCYETNRRGPICYRHFIDAAKFMIPKLTCVRIRAVSYMGRSLREEEISYITERDIPHSIFDSLQAVFRSLDEYVDFNPTKVRDFLNNCFYRHANALSSTLSAAHSQQEDTASVVNIKDDIVEVKPSSMLCETSNTPESFAPGQDHSIKEECASYVVENTEDVKSLGLQSGTSSTTEFIADECTDYAAEELGESDPGLLERIIPIKEYRLLSLLRFCPKCGTQISRKGSRIVLSDMGPSAVAHYFCNSCGGERCWYAT
ncbi:hypothetical protein Aduo_013686 [Ancylostoma duodenale]